MLAGVGTGLRKAHPARPVVEPAVPLHLRALIHVKVLAALLVGERPRDLPTGDLDEVVDVEGPDPNAVAPAREASFVPSGLKLTPATAHPEPRRTSCCAPVSASNSRTVPSSLAVATRDPSGLKATSVTPPDCPSSTDARVPLSTFQIPTGPSGPAVAIREPLGSKSKLDASALIVRTTSPRPQSQILTWLLPCSVRAAVATRRPSGLKRASLTSLNPRPSSCRTRITWPDRSMIFAVPPQAAVTRNSPSGLKSTLVDVELVPDPEELLTRGCIPRPCR